MNVRTYVYSHDVRFQNPDDPERSKKETELQHTLEGTSPQPSPLILYVDLTRYVFPSAS
jgi:hypothetical protein